jgi:adenosylmethionine-8-amino-7-oxononanoate aminotransferase
MKIKRPKFPALRKCTVGEMLNAASQLHGFVKDGRKAAILAEALTNIAQLSRIPLCKWSERKKALRALENIDRIGIMDSLELLNPKQSCSRFEGGVVNEMKKVAEWLGVFVYKVDNLIVVTRKPLTIASEDRTLAEMPPPPSRGIES